MFKQLKAKNSTLSVKTIFPNSLQTFTTDGHRNGQGSHIMGMSSYTTNIDPFLNFFNRGCVVIRSHCTPRVLIKYNLQQIFTYQYNTSLTRYRYNWRKFRKSFKRMRKNYWKSWRSSEKEASWITIYVKKFILKSQHKYTDPTLSSHIILDR